MHCSLDTDEEYSLCSFRLNRSVRRVNKAANEYVLDCQRQIAVLIRVEGEACKIQINSKVQGLLRFSSIL